MRLLVRLLVRLLAAAAVAAAALECPLPGGPDSADQPTCEQFSACLWADGRCVLSDDTGYLVQEVHVIHTGYEALLQRKSGVTMFGDDVQTLRATAIEYDDFRLGLAIRDNDAERYEVPVELDLPSLPTEPPTQSEYTIELSAPGDSFTVNISHGGRPVMTSLPQLVYSDQFIEVTFLLGAADVYGFGENNHDQLRHDLAAGRTWPLFAHDHGPGFDTENLYGVHPFFLGIDDDAGASFGVLLLNSNAMEYKLFLLDGRPALTYRTTGGILDLYLFFGGSPLAVLQQYHRTIGPAGMPAYWALGFQLCRYGYSDVQDIRDTRARMKAAAIPQDVQYADIDYMDGRRDFTWDGDKFADLPAFIQQQRDEDGVRFVLIYDPTVATDFGAYPPVDRGVAADAFVRWWNASLVPADQCAGCGEYVAAHVWPQSLTLFPNFLANRTVRWWGDEIERFRAAVGRPDGFWIDMNEPSAFDTNTGRARHNRVSGGLQCPQTRLDFPPYPTSFTRAAFNPSGTLADHTICMSSAQDSEVAGHSVVYRHYDVHSLYGWAEARATRSAIAATMGGRRSLLLSRSTFVGSGRWAAHWTGDNTARWSDMKRSVVGVLEFSMFGIPHVGADICGFNGATTEQLCLRWTQLGAFYPFSRNHNSIDNPPQDPAMWPSVAAAARQALGLRYRLLPYLYTLFWRAAEMAELVARPLPFQFADDPALRGVDTQFLWGDAVMVAPVLDEQAMTSVDVTFPAGEWYDLRDGSLAYSADQSGSRPYTVPMDAMVPVFARGGAVLPLQTNDTTTAASRRHPFQLAVFGASATGALFWDDGETTDTYAAGRFYHCAFRFADGALDMQVTVGDTQWMQQPVVSEVTFHGAAGEPAAVLVDGTALDPALVTYSSDVQVLTVQTQLDMAHNHRVQLNF